MLNELTLAARILGKDRPNSFEVIEAGQTCLIKISVPLADKILSHPAISCEQDSPLRFDIDQGGWVKRFKFQEVEKSIFSMTYLLKGHLLAKWPSRISKIESDGKTRSLRVRREIDVG